MLCVNIWHRNGHIKVDMQQQFALELVQKSKII